MSTTAIKDVTRALQVLLLSQLSAISNAAQVSLLPPADKLPSGLGVNLYLFRVQESAFSKNMNWPGDATTQGSNVPALGLELSYLLTPYAPAPDPATATGDDAHTMLGAAMLTLQENPILNRVHIPGFDADTVLPQPILASYEQVKVTLAATSIDELSKIWATINQPYRLSVAYHVSLVQLTPTPPPPVNPAPVLAIDLDVTAWNAPRIDSLSPASTALARVDGTGALLPNSLTIAGSSLSFQNQTPVVQVGGQNAVVNLAPSPTASSLSVALPTSVDGGPNASVSVSLNGRAGAPLPLLVTPWLSGIVPIRSTLEAPALALAGSGFTASPNGVRFEGAGGTSTVTAFVGAPTDAKAMVNIPATLQNGLYTVRIVLGDASRSASNGATLEVIPAVTSPIGIVAVAVGGNQVHRLTINGARLNGGDVRLIIDSVAYAAGTNANATQIVFTLGRLLNSGAHGVAVSVNGSVSHQIALVIP